MIRRQDAIVEFLYPINGQKRGGKWLRPQLHKCVRAHNTRKAPRNVKVQNLSTIPSLKATADHVAAFSSPKLLLEAEGHGRWNVSA